VIRRARIEDLDTLVPLQHEVHGLHVAQRPDQFKLMSDDDGAAALRGRLEATNVKIWLAERASQVVGYVIAAEQQREAGPWCPARTAKAIRFERRPR
jgi:hypothetical protein